MWIPRVRGAWENLNSWYGTIEESWIPQGFGYAFGPPKRTDTLSSKQLLNMKKVGVYINESGKSSVMRSKTPNLDQPFQVYWNLEHLLGTRKNRVKGLMSHALSVLVREEEAAKHFTDFAHTERTSVSALLNGEGQRRLLLAINEHGAAGAEVGQQKQEQEGLPPAKRAKR